MSNREDICKNIIIFSLLGTYGIIVLLAHLIGSLLAPNLSTLSCIRVESSQFSCELTSSGILGIYKIQIPSEQLKSAEIDETGCDPDCSYQIILKTTKGQIPRIAIAGHYSDRFDTQKNIDRINLFIENKNQKTLMIRKDDRWVIIYTVIVWGAIPSFILYAWSKPKY